MPNILLSCAGRRHYLAEYFVEAIGGAGRVVGTDMDPTAPALVACDRRRLVPAVAAPDYLERLIEVIAEEEIDMVFSLNDLELELLSRNRDAIEACTGATVYVAPEASMAIGADKWLTYQFALRHGIPTPATFLDVASAREAIGAGRCATPLIVKPRWGSASIGLVRVESADALEAAYQTCRNAVAGSALAVFGLDGAVMIQERIEGSEYGVDILYGRDEAFIGFAAKRKLTMRAGETDKAVTVEPARFRASVERITRNLPHRGNLDCDFLERDEELLLLEINPRFGGGYPFTHMAGANHVAILLADFAGRPLPPYGYGIDRTFAKYDCLTETPAHLA
ncbi:ATP-grasp domain-containing protein (plasmid) [Sphingobium yanoikuyae]|uniref:ATP-grasp domain-containing protein n=1 Tax=Sphingobium yanoikuyae TaxID=13690 RepID=A0A6P1GR80_SPHYA|nr:ATP-grasp domain-containing protein [Sphingobium yanoikuyae]QHD70724.1 ATP-grasp domain-containing protein [Sphingobium yanoikuyae]